MTHSLSLSTANAIYDYKQLGFYIVKRQSIVFEQVSLHCYTALACTPRPNSEAAQSVEKTGSQTFGSMQVWSSDDWMKLAIGT